MNKSWPILLLTGALLAGWLFVFVNGLSGNESFALRWLAWGFGGMILGVFAFMMSVNKNMRAIGALFIGLLATFLIFWTIEHGEAGAALLTGFASMLLFVEMPGVAEVEKPDYTA